MTVTLGSRRARHRSSPPRLATLLAALLAGCGGAPEERPELQVPAVEAVPARSGTLPVAERVSGVVKAENQVAIRPEVAAPVAAVLVRTGETVSRGQPLVRLRDEALRDQLRQAEAAVALAEAAAAEARARLTAVEAQVTRTRALAAEALVSELDLETQEASLAAARAAAEQAAARVQQARATVEERRSELARTVVRAPVAGRVGARNAEVGMLVDPSTVLFQLGDPGRLVVEVPLTQEMLADVAVGQPALVYAPGDGEPLRATLSRISPFLVGESFSTTGEIDLANPGGRLSPGAFVPVDLLHGETESATLVPASALVEDLASGELGVWVVAGMPAAAAPTAEVEGEPRAVRFQAVELVAHGGGTAGIRGLGAGDWVVTVGQHLLAAGEESRARVRVQSWERAMELQAMQREDLLRDFLARQQRWARSRGAEPPSSAEFLGRDGPAGRAGGGGR